MIAALGEQQFSVLARLPDSVDRSRTQRLPADVAIADYESALRLLNSQEVRRERVIILTHRDSQASICHALEQGAWGYLLLGCSIADVVNGIRLVQGGTRALGPQVAAREVLRQIILGLSNKRIASELSLAVGTVKAHVKSILARLGAISRTHAVAMARRYGITPEDGDCIARPAVVSVTTGPSRPTAHRTLEQYQ